VRRRKGSTPADDASDVLLFCVTAISTVSKAKSRNFSTC